MITGEIKNKIDQIWDTFFVAGITNPITVLEQMTYIFFMKMLDDKQLQEEENARDWDSEVQNPTFLEGQLWVNPDAVSDEERAGVPYENLRWHVFKNFGAENMFKIVRQSVFEFIKHIGTGEESAYSRYMKSAIFLIPNARTLAKVIDGVDALDMNNRDAMGDVYEYILGKMAASGTNGQFRTPRHIIRMIVEMMEPTPQDYICDPAMGSAGFLVEAVKYIKENYETAQTEKGGLPIVIVGSVTNKSDGAASQAYGDLLKAIPDTLRIELFNSNLFDVKNDELSVTFAQRILASDKSPVEDGELMSALKQHGSPDFVIIGDIRLFADHGKRKTCRVHLALHSLKTGKVVWEGKKTAVK